MCQRDAETLAGHGNVDKHATPFRHSLNRISTRKVLAAH
jgi:hypothetical protein